MKSGFGKFSSVAAFLFTSAVFVSCDYIKEPYENIQVSGPNNGIIVYADSAHLNEKKVLLEDFTGHKCGNCPRGGDTVQLIAATYGHKVIPVSIHSGYWSTLSSPDYTYNWVVESPTKPGYCALDEFFQVSDQGNPNGMVNRKDYDIVNFNHVKGTDAWRTEVAAQTAGSPSATIYLINKYDPTTKNLETTAKVRFTSALTGQYKIATMIIEDSIVKPQKDYRVSPDDILNFNHRHVLRGYMYGAFGENIGNLNPAANDTTSKTYTATLNGTDWNEDHVHVVVYVYNAANYEIIQVEELKIK